MAKQSSSRQQQRTVANAVQCRINGHILRKTLYLGERLCTRCGKKVYCPACTTTIPQDATLVYCFEHDPQEAEATERNVRS